MSFEGTSSSGRRSGTYVHFCPGLHALPAGSSASPLDVLHSLLHPLLPRCAALLRDHTCWNKVCYLASSSQSACAAQSGTAQRFSGVPVRKQPRQLERPHQRPLASGRHAASLARRCRRRTAAATGSAPSAAAHLKAKGAQGSRLYCAARPQEHQRACMRPTAQTNTPPSAACRPTCSAASCTRSASASACAAASAFAICSGVRFTALAATLFWMPCGNARCCIGQPGPAGAPGRHTLWVQLCSQMLALHRLALFSSPPNRLPSTCQPLGLPLHGCQSAARKVSRRR